MTDTQQRDPDMWVWLTLVLIHIELNFGAATELSAGQCAAIASDCELDWHAALVGHAVSRSQRSVTFAATTLLQPAGSPP